jgi:hypothetical protein
LQKQPRGRPIGKKQVNFFLMDTSNLDDRQKEHINLMPDQILAQKKMSTMRGMGCYGGMGGMSSMGGM